MGQRGPIGQVVPMPGVPQRTDRPLPKRVSFDPQAPTRPSLGGVATEEWDRIVPQLDAKGLLAVVDQAVLVTYCDAVGRQHEARRLLDAEGLMAKGQKGEPIKHPAWMIYTQSGSLIAQLAKELFASPNARLRSNLPEAPDEPEGEDILD